MRRRPAPRSRLARRGSPEAPPAPRPAAAMRPGAVLARSRSWGPLLSEPLQALVHAAACSVARALEQLGQLVIGKPEHRTAVHGRPLLGWKPFHRRPQLRLVELEAVGARRGLRDARHGHGPPAPGAMRVDGLVLGDLEDPGTQ